MSAWVAPLCDVAGKRLNLVSQHTEAGAELSAPKTVSRAGGVRNVPALPAAAVLSSRLRQMPVKAASRRTAHSVPAILLWYWLLLLLQADPNCLVTRLVDSAHLTGVNTARQQTNDCTSSSSSSLQSLVMLC